MAQAPTQQLAQVPRPVAFIPVGPSGQGDSPMTSDSHESPDTGPEQYDYEDLFKQLPKNRTLQDRPQFKGLTGLLLQKKIFKIYSVSRTVSVCKQITLAIRYYIIPFTIRFICYLFEGGVMCGSFPYDPYHCYI